MKMQKQIEVGCETLHRDPRTSSGPGSLNFLRFKSGPVLIHSDISREWHFFISALKNSYLCVFGRFSDSRILRTQLVLKQDALTS